MWLKVKHISGALRALGVERGDRVLIYMPMIPETLMGMLAVNRLGAAHVIVFGGFAAKELAVRISHTRVYAHPMPPIPLIGLHADWLNDRLSDIIYSIRALWHLRQSFY